MQHLLLACGEPVVIVASAQMGTKLIPGSQEMCQHQSTQMRSKKSQSGARLRLSDWSRHTVLQHGKPLLNT
jgi:hypothetical protein